MNPFFKLAAFRKYKNWEQENEAKELSISLEEYKDLESGLDSVDAETALKLSELYRVPPQFFLTNDSTHLSVIYSHCNFENSNGYVNHLYHDEKLAAAQEKEIQLLREEVKRLQNQNEQLVQSILIRK